MTRRIPNWPVPSQPPTVDDYTKVLHELKVSPDLVHALSLVFHLENKDKDAHHALQSHLMSTLGPAKHKDIVTLSESLRTDALSAFLTKHKIDRYLHSKNMHTAYTLFESAKAVVKDTGAPELLSPHEYLAKQKKVRTAWKEYTGDFSTTDPDSKLDYLRDDYAKYMRWMQETYPPWYGKEYTAAIRKSKAYF